MKRLIPLLFVVALLAGCVTPLYVTKMPAKYLCSACGNGNYSITYAERGSVLLVNGSLCRFDEPALKYRCSRCGYENLTYVRGANKGRKVDR